VCFFYPANVEVAEDDAETAGEFYICEDDDHFEGCPRIYICQIDEAKEFRAARSDKAEADDEEDEEDDDNGEVDDADENGGKNANAA
jgi:hypothetical protein